MDHTLWRNSLKFFNHCKVKFDLNFSYSIVVKRKVSSVKNTVSVAVAWS